MRYMFLVLLISSCSTTYVPVPEEVPKPDIDMELDMIFNKIGG